MRLIPIKSKETVCKERAEALVEKHYGGVLGSMISNGADAVSRGGFLRTETAYKYQKIREMISEYEDRMYLYFLETYEKADDALASDLNSSEFIEDKAILGLQDRAEVVGSEKTQVASESISESISGSSLSVGGAIRALNRELG